MSKLILNSRGLNTYVGTEQICNALHSVGKEDFADKIIYVVSYPEYGVDNNIISNLLEFGFTRSNIYMSADGVCNDIIPDIVYITEGNTFEVLDYMRKTQNVTYIREMVMEKNAIYCGSSAGAIIAGTDIELAKDFDSNFVGMTDFEGLQLFNGTIIPHYETDELERYVKNTEKELIGRYENIYSVNNEMVLILER